MKTKNIVIFASLIIVSLLFGVFWVIAPAHMKDKVVGLVTFASADRQCFNYYKNKEDYFKDPDSAYIESSSILTKKDDGEVLKLYPLALKWSDVSIVQVKVFARNSMGGYGTSDIICPLEENNTFSEFRTSFYILEVATEQSKIENCTKAVNIGKKYLSAHLIEYCSEYF